MDVEKKMIKKIATLFLLTIFVSATNAAVIVNDASFENINIDPNSFQYNPVSPDWTFIDEAGVIDPFAAFSSLEAPDGEQFSFIQRGGSFFQDIFFPVAGEDTISYFEAGRIPIPGLTHIQGNLGYEISVGGDVFHTDSTFTSQSFSLVEANFFTTAGTHSITFKGVTFSSDDTGYFDAISINEVSSIPAPAAIWLFGSGLIGLIGVRKKSSIASTLSA